MVERLMYLMVYFLFICFSDFFLLDFNIFDNCWYYMCIRGLYDGFWRYFFGLWKIRIVVSCYKDFDI